LKGKQLNDRGLAYRLREFGVKSRTLNLGGESRAKGYVREDLHDAWKRYLTPPPPLPQGSVTSVTSVTEPDFQGSKVTDVTGNERSVTDDGTGKSADESTGGADVTDVTHVAGNGRFADDPDCLRRAPNGGNGFRPPRGNGWHLVGDKPPGQAGARVWLKEVWPPALGPEGDDVFDLTGSA
jgi:uncharacterized protein DUF3631